MLHRLVLVLLLAFPTLQVTSSPAWSHGGDLDRYGCHHNRLQGGYHCHRGAFKGGMFDSKAEMLLGSERLSQTPSQPEQTQPTTVQEFTGRVVTVSSGDTLMVLHKGKPERIRLYGIDCPEKRQAFGKLAKQFASRLVYGKEITVRGLGLDRYGRTIADVMLPDGRMLNEELLKAGFAWWYRKYTPDNDTLKQLEHEAREAKRGLWADPHPVPPWEWRTMRKRYP